MFVRSRYSSPHNQVAINNLSAALPSIDELRCFLAAARELNFRSAARSVALTPAALSQRIKGLEQRLGTRLFERTTRRVHLTQEGMALVPVAERCCAAAAECFEVVKPGSARTPVELVVGTRYELGLSWLVPALKTLRTDLPWLRVHLYFGSGPDILARVRSAEIDGAVTSARFSDARLETTALHEERYVFVGAKKLLDKKPLRTVADAAHHVLLDAGSDLPLFRYFREGAGGLALSFGEVIRLGSIGAIEHEVQQGEGVAVLPRYLVEDDLKSKRLVQLFPKVAPLFDIFRLVYRKADPRRAAFEELAEALRAQPLK